MSVVEEYWSGVLQRLQAEVDVFNRLIQHAGEKGRENEFSLARVLANLVPQRYGIGSGVLIDSKDNYSSQTDIVIFNQADDPAILAQTNQVLFPVENVHACIEVKTSVGASEIRDAAGKAASVRKLSSTADIPIYALVGYNATSLPATIADNLMSLPVDDRPTLVCLISQGFLAGNAGILTNTSATGYTCGLAGLHAVDTKGARISDTFAEPEADFVDPVFSRHGNRYPITMPRRNKYAVVEPSRALLLFCEALLRALASREKRPAPTISNYLPAITRELLLIAQ